MATDLQKLRVGIFLCICIALIIVAAFFSSINKFNKVDILYNTYFSQSVQGLLIDSEVKFRGINVGRVSKIILAPDSALVQVTIAINPASNFSVVESNVIKLIAANITGMKYLEIDFAKSNMTVETKYDFDSDYPIIPSEHTTQFSDIIDLMYNQINSINITGISERAVLVLDNINLILNNEKFFTIVSNVNLTAENASIIAQRLNNILDSGQIQTSLVYLTDSLKKISELSASINTEEIENIIKSINNLVERINTIAYNVDIDSRKSLSDVQKILINLKNFSEQLKTRPSQTLFSTQGSDNE